MRRRFLLLSTLAFLPTLAQAQALPQGLSIELPAERPYGPHTGWVVFKVINSSGERVRFAKTPVTLRVITENGDVFQEESIERLPYSFEWDTKMATAGRYRLELWVTMSIGAERRPYRLDQTPLLQIGNPPSPPAPVIVQKPHFADRTETIKGEFNTAIVDWLTDAPANTLPMVRVMEDGKLRNLVGVGGSAPYTLHLDTTNYPAGKYRLELIALNWETEKETPVNILDALDIEITKPAVRIPARAPESSTFLTAPDVARLSGELGDSHPYIAAAQWALESAWGQLPCAHYNYFGIKARDDQPGAEKETHEFENGEWITIRARFAHFTSAKDGIKARLTFLQKPRYASYWSATSDESAARALQSAGYATDPNYATKLIRLAHQIAGMSVSGDVAKSPTLPVNRGDLASRQSPPRMVRTAPPKTKKK